MVTVFLSCALLDCTSGIFNMLPMCVPLFLPLEWVSVQSVLSIITSQLTGMEGRKGKGGVIILGITILTPTAREFCGFL